MPQCPLCSKYVLVTAGQNADDRMNVHMNSRCQALVLEEKATAKRKVCGLPGCRNPENFDLVSCRSCGKQYCLTHRHPETHKCEKASGAASVPSGRPLKAGERLLEKLREEKARRAQQPQQNGERKRAPAAAQSQPQIQPSASPSPSPSPALPMDPHALAQRRRAASQRLRGSALGDDRVKTEDRVYFDVSFPSLLEYPSGGRPRWLSHAFYFSRNWTVGRALDFVCEHAGIENRNNVASAKKLLMVVSDTGVDLPTDVTFGLLDPSVASGDSLRVEYDPASGL